MSRKRGRRKEGIMETAWTSRHGRILSQARTLILPKVDALSRGRFL